MENLDKAFFCFKGMEAFGFFADLAVQVFASFNFRLGSAHAFFALLCERRSLRCFFELNLKFLNFAWQKGLLLLDLRDRFFQSRKHILRKLRTDIGKGSGRHRVLIGFIGIGGP
ncbi:hypothetical protein D3C87_1263150 [compost metagenome]